VALSPRIPTPTTPWIVSTIGLLVISAMMALLVARTINSVDEKQFDAGVESYYSSLEDRINGFRLLGLAMPVLVDALLENGEPGEMTSAMEQGSFGLDPSLLVSSFPLDGITALGRVDPSPDGDYTMTMLFDLAGIGRFGDESGALAEAAEMARTQNRVVTSDPFTHNRDPYYAQLTPLGGANDSTIALFVDAEAFASAPLEDGAGVDLAITLVDGSTPLISQDPGPRLLSERTLPFMGRDWSVTLTPGPNFEWQNGTVTGEVLFGMAVAIASLVYWLGVTSRRRAMEQAHRLEIADQVNRDKDRFITAISHELRTPLTAVYGLATGLIEDDSSYATDEARELGAIVAQQSHEMSMLVEDLLVAARTESGMITVIAEEMEAALEIRRVIEGLGIIDKIEYRRGGASALADPLRVRQIVRNLLTNALRHGGDRIQIKTTMGHEVVCIEVCDDGPEIAGTAREEMFAPYYRSSRASGLAPSVGLGLSVSRELARLMNGELTYHFDNGTSVFRLTLPSVPGGGADSRDDRDGLEASESRVSNGA